MPLSGGNGLTADGIRQLFRQGRGLRYVDVIDESLKQSKIEGLNYQQARALHWALNSSPNTYAWIDPKERRYLEKLGIRQTLLEDLNQKKPVVDYYFFELERHFYYQGPSPSTPPHASLSTMDGERLVAGAIPIFRNALAQIPPPQPRPDTPSPSSVSRPPLPLVGGGTLY